MPANVCDKTGVSTARMRLSMTTGSAVQPKKPFRPNRAPQVAVRLVCREGSVPRERVHHAFHLLSSKREDEGVCHRPYRGQTMSALRRI